MDIQFFFCFTIFWDFNLMVSQSSGWSSWYPTGSLVWYPGALVTTIMGHKTYNTPEEQTPGEMTTWSQTMVRMLWRKSHLWPTTIPTFPSLGSIITITTTIQTWMTTSISMWTSINISNSMWRSMCMFTSTSINTNMTTFMNMRPQWVMAMTAAMITNIFMTIQTMFPSQSGEESITRSNLYEIYVS